jgi:hypothetical protein
LPDWSLSNDVETLKLEMFLSKLPPGMKQLHDFTRHSVNRTEIRAFEKITSVTSQPQVIRRIVTTMLSSDDVFHMKCEVNCRLREMTILAA